jgi:hypothetical protein
MEDSRSHAVVTLQPTKPFLTPKKEILTPPRFPCKQAILGCEGGVKKG